MGVLITIHPVSGTGVGHWAHLGCVLAGMAYFGSLSGRGIPSPLRLRCERPQGLRGSSRASMECQEAGGFPTAPVQYAATVSFYVAVRHAFASIGPDGSPDAWPCGAPEDGCEFMRRCAGLFDLTCSQAGSAPHQAWEGFAELARQAGLPGELDGALPPGLPSARRAL